MLWGLQRVEPQAAYGLAVDRLRRQIQSGLLLPDEKLPPERQLSDTFGISRVTLREALRVLETDRYVHVRRGSQGGTFVADGEVLNTISLRRISREPANAMRVLEFLCSNERTALDLALDRLGPQDLVRLRQAIAMMRVAQAAPELKQAETLFHLGLGDASHNTLFSAAIADAWAEMFMPLDGAGGGVHGGLLESHEALLEAIETRAPDKAGAALAVIHERWWLLVRRLIRRAA